jgi:hypothetical protein
MWNWQLCDIISKTAGSAIIGEKRLLIVLSVNCREYIEIEFLERKFVEFTLRWRFCLLGEFEI